MYLSRLTLNNFRNLVELDLELAPGVVVFFGPNAQGKTTLLEAVYLLAVARSFRAENEREVLNFQAAAEGGQGLVGGTSPEGGRPGAGFRGVSELARPAVSEDAPCRLPAGPLPDSRCASRYASTGSTAPPRS